MKNSKIFENSEFLNNLPKIKILQISDIHWDPYYQEGSLAACSETLCCRETVINPYRNAIPKEKSAGKYGDYRSCDTPEVTLDSMIQHIQNNHKIPFYLIMYAF